MTQSEIEELLEKLKKARASGVLTSTHGDHTLTFKSDSQMAAAIADLEKQLADASSTRRRGVYYTFQRGKGL